MSNKLNQTLTDLRILKKGNIEFVLTRFWRDSNQEPDDLDILVRPKDFSNFIKLLNQQRYESFSHDQALGGRIKGMQKNLVKDSRIKIDLHQDFTWRKSRYLDLDIIWNNLEKNKINNVSCLMPKLEIDVFIIIINIIFEKTYITSDDFKFIKKYLPEVFKNPLFDMESKKYGWNRTYQLFKRWFLSNEKNKFPVFLPIYLVIFSYIEKFFHDKKIDAVSFMYYVFFRTRFQINGVLPYE